MENKPPSKEHRKVTAATVPKGPQTGQQRKDAAANDRSAHKHQAHKK
jgi:hypothetical protein